LGLKTGDKGTYPLLFFQVLRFFSKNPSQLFSPFQNPKILSKFYGKFVSIFGRHSRHKNKSDKFSKISKI